MAAAHLSFHGGDGGLSVVGFCTIHPMGRAYGVFFGLWIIGLGRAVYGCMEKALFVGLACTRGRVQQTDSRPVAHGLGLFRRQFTHKFLFHHLFAAG